MEPTPTGLRALVDRHRAEIVRAARRHHGRSVSLFGSVARLDARADSDIDFLVDFDEGSSLFDLIGLQEDLSSLLGVPVDVVSSGGLRERDGAIRREAIPL